jgi:hypothetical protein
MASRLSSVGFIRGCSAVMAIEMTPVAITPTAQIISGEGKTMHSVAKRMAIGTAALAAAGLFGSLPYNGSVLADQGVPVQHHDVALVDTSSPLDAIVGYETSLDDSLYSGLYNSTTGLYAELYNNAVTALGSNADALLGTTALAGADGLFDGAANSFSSGVFLDTWAAEDELNQLLGISATSSETAILADIAHDPIVLASVTDLLPTAGSSTFDADLMSLATGDFTAATTEFTTYLDSLPSLLGDLGGLSGVLGDLGGGDLGGLLSSILGDLGLGSLGL